MAEDLIYGECPECGRRIMLRTTASGNYVYGKCQGWHSEDGAHCGYSFTHGRKKSKRIIAEAARIAAPEPKETEDDGEDTETGPEPGSGPGRAAPDRSGDAAGRGRRIGAIRRR